MLLVEHDGKKLLAQLGIAVPASQLLPLETTTLPTPSGNGPWFLKAQILQGQRGKRGFVRRVERAEEFSSIFSELRNLIGTEPCAGILLEQATNITQEWFVSCEIDRQSGEIRTIVSAEGGMEIAASALSPQENNAVPAVIQETLQILTSALPSLDALSIEINPLALLANGQVMAIDAKIELDDAASFRHSDWQEFSELSRHGRARSPREHAYLEYNVKANPAGSVGRYVELDGDIAMILAGGGASLVAMDALRLVGGQPANYLEMSGNPDPAYVRGGAEIALSHPHIRGIWIAGSFANFTDIQRTIHAILEAVTISTLRVPIVIRRDGPQADEAETEALAWAKEQNIPLRFHRGDIDLGQSAQELMQLIASYELATL